MAHKTENKKGTSLLDKIFGLRNRDTSDFVKDYNKNDEPTRNDSDTRVVKPRDDDNLPYTMPGGADTAEETEEDTDTVEDGTDTVEEDA